MTKQHVSFLLILILLVTSVTSVFNHYASMESQLFAKHFTVMTDLAGDADHAVVSDSGHCQQHDKSKRACHTNSLCSFSVCGYGDIISTAFLFMMLAYTAYRYRKIKQSFLRSIVLPPEIKPPIYNF